MPLWSDRIASSPFLSNVNQANDVLGNLEGVIDESSEEGQILDRIRFALNHTFVIYTATDYRLVSEQVIVALEANSEQLLKQLREFQESQDISNLNVATDQINHLIDRASQLSNLARVPAEEVLDNAVQTFNQRAGQLNSRLETASFSFQKTIEEVDQQLKTLESTVNSTSNDFEGKTAEFTTRILGEMERLNQAISSNESRYLDSERDRAQQFATTQAEQSSAFKDDLDKHRESGQELIDYLQSKREEAEQILGTTAASVTAGKFLEDAIEQRGQADFWRWVAVGSFIVAVAMGFVTLRWLGPTSGTLTTETIFFYIGRTIMLGGPFALAGFAIRESSNHRSRERQSRRIGNQLSTFRPFLAELEVEEVNEQIKNASPRFFTGYEDTDNSGE